jgi:hypothetical protein
MTNETLINEIYTLPDNLKQEVLHYVQFLKQKQSDKSEVPTPHRSRKAGSAEGKFTMADDFEAPLDDFAEYM